MAQRPSVQEWVQRWQSGAQQKSGAYTQGIQNSKDWAANAVAAGPARNAGLQAAMADGRIDAGIQRVGTNGWRTATLAKGPTAWLNGISNSTAKATAGAQRLYTMLDQAQNEIAGLPRGTKEENIARMVAHTRAMIAAKQQRS